MGNHTDKKITYVNTGEVQSGGIDTVLNSGAIGSCVVVTAFDPKNKVGAMAHVMLPGTAPIKNQLNANKYAVNAICELINQLNNLGTKTEDIKACMIGGANVLQRAFDTIGRDNIVSVQNILLEEKIAICANATGGILRRTVLFDIESGCIYYTEGDSKKMLLWKSKKLKKQTDFL